MNLEYRPVAIKPLKIKLAQSNLSNIHGVERVILSTDTDIRKEPDHIKKLLAHYAFVLGDWEVIDINIIAHTPGVNDRVGVITSVTDPILIAFMNKYLPQF